ncbi:Nucleoside diphosphate kinase [Candidatus Gugararchaeum adminiculabundum]|nr:Nucleoside diphosphate kinase [Candidatus Gugararchaeum adminiculabundum]
MALERTFVILKPDALQRGLIGKVISRFEERGLKIVADKMGRMEKRMCDEHYSHLKDKQFFTRLVSFMTSAPVIYMVLEGAEAVEMLRGMCGATNARKAAVGTIRGDFALSTQCNIIHASDSKETAEKEVARFFSKEEIFEWVPSFEKFIYADDEK